MKLIFEKSDDGQINITQENNGSSENFSYLKVIKSLLTEGKIEGPQFQGDFDEPELMSIKSMIDHMNSAASEYAAETESLASTKD